MIDVKKWISGLEHLELHHKVISFCIIIVLTIALTRGFVLFHNPNPMLFNFELHHFDYGIFLLLFSTLWILFGTRKWYPIHFLLMGIGFGLIIDDVWFIRTNVLDPDLTEMMEYNSTLPIVMGLTVVVLLTAAAINYGKQVKQKIQYGNNTTKQRNKELLKRNKNL